MRAKAYGQRMFEAGVNFGKQENYTESYNAVKGAIDAALEYEKRWIQNHSFNLCGHSCISYDYFTGKLTDDVFEEDQSIML